MDKKSAGNMPEKKFRAGAISATIWLNQATAKDGKLVQYRTISIERAYKDKSDEWKYTNSFRVGDLPKASLVLDEAFKHLVLKQLQDTSVGASDSAVVYEDDEEVVM
jgi:hypothetical protein